MQNIRKMNTENIDLTVAREFVVGLMPQAGVILRNHFNSNDLKSSLKNPRDLVTQADLDVDKFLREHIREKFPSSQFLTEETVPKGPQGIDRSYSYFRNLDNLWIIDPLDGTWNFFKGNSNFAISVALVSRAVARVSVVYVPMADKLYFAQEDLEHTFLNGEQVKGISSTQDLEGCGFACDWVPDERGRQRTFRLFSRVAGKVGPIKSMGSAVTDLASFTEGQIDAYLNCGLKPWDVAATSLLVKKEGGIVTTPKGEVWDIFEPDIFVSTPNLHPQFIRLFNQR